MTKAEIDQAFLDKHIPLTERFYQAKRAGKITPTLQALFDKAHGFLTLLHNKALIANGMERDYYVDEERDEEGNLLKAGTMLRSGQITDLLATLHFLTDTERQAVKDRWGVEL